MWVLSCTAGLSLDRRCQQARSGRCPAVPSALRTANPGAGGPSCRAHAPGSVRSVRGGVWIDVSGANTAAPHQTKLKYMQQQALGRQECTNLRILKIGVQTAAQQAEPLQRSVEQCAALRCSNCIELLNLFYVLALRAHDHHAPLLLRAWLDGRPHLMQTNMLLEPGRTNCTAAGHTVLDRLSCTQP